MKNLVRNLAFASILLFAPNVYAQTASKLENPNSLSNFFSDLAKLKNPDNKTPVHIVMIGDSHTASDLISSSLRYELQSKFGNAGRGLIQAGNPYDGFAPMGLVVKTPKKWTNAISFPQSKSDVGPFGLGGFRSRVIETPDSYSLDAAIGNEFNRVSICGNVLEEKTELEFEILNSIGKISFDKINGEINCAIAKLPEDTSQLKIRSIANQKPIGLSSIGTWHDSSGVVLSSFGIVGSQLSDFSRRSLKSIASEFAVLPPSLIILEFGTNEGFDANFDAQKYGTLLESQIANLKRIAPNASILIIGAPDANKKASNANGDDCAIINKEISAKFPNISFSDTKAAYYSPPNLKSVRKVQAEVAQKLNIAYWDWFNSMGGECSANSLALKDPKEVLGDRVHFSKLGAQKIGVALALDIVTSFESEQTNQK